MPSNFLERLLHSKEVHDCHEFRDGQFYLYCVINIVLKIFHAKSNLHNWHAWLSSYSFFIRFERSLVHSLACKDPTRHIARCWQSSWLNMSIVRCTKMFDYVYVVLTHLLNSFFYFRLLIYILEFVFLFSEIKNNGLLLENEIKLDGPIVSCIFDDLLDMV